MEKTRLILKYKCNIRGYMIECNNVHLNPCWLALNHPRMVGFANLKNEIVKLYWEVILEREQNYIENQKII